MLTTGILSLNIHDSLTFEGIEICLNPDLFTSELCAGSQKNNRGTGTGAESTASGNSTSASHVSTTTMSVGDIIEIRVWDPLPKEAGGVKSPSSSAGTIRKRFQQAPILPTPSMTHDRESPINAYHIGGAGDPSLRPRTAIYPSNSSLRRSSSLDPIDNDGQKSMISSPKSCNILNKKGLLDNHKSIETTPELGGGRNDGKYSSSLPTKTAGTPILNSNSMSATTPTITNNAINPTGIASQQQQLPPVFPRNRSGTADLNMSSASKPPKPTMAHRRASSTANVVPLPQRSPKQQQQPLVPPTRHSRDISDMTADTTYQLDNIINDAMIHHRSDSPETADEVVENDAMSEISSKHRLRLSFVLKVMEKTLTSFKGNRIQISVLRQIAELYNLSTYDLVTVHKIEPQDEEEVLKAVSADFVVVTIKDQFISRGDMLLFQTKLIGSWIHEGQRLTETTRGIKAHAREIRHGNYSAKSGIVTDKTMINFRSRSARIIWLVQLSSEMWDYSSPYEREYEPESVCEIYFDQWIRFLYKLFKKWKELEVTHSLTVIFFSRTFLSNGVKSSLDCEDVYGTRFEDHYKPVIENETCSDWDSLIVRIKEEFIKYPLEVGWNLTDRKPSCASQGNLLEAINVVLNLMQYHYLDRDLHRTGQSIVIVSPGCGVFEVDKGLAGITYQRMMDNGIGSDMLSLGLPPLHIAPFFLYNNEYRAAEKQGIDAGETYYEVPHWMHLSFVIYDRPEEKQVYLSGLEDKNTPLQSSSWLDAYDIRANGFLRPPKFRQNITQGTQSLNPKTSMNSSFSAVGNRAATPGKAKLIQEQGQARQLISGRKFRDILEACRPRELGASMPSALQSLLNLRDFARENEAEKNNGTALLKKPFKETDCRLREWGTVDFNDLTLHSRLKSSRSLSPSQILVRRSIKNQFMTNSDKSFSSNDESSGSSSFRSNSILSTHGTSSDRVFWDYYESPKTPMRAFEMQRSSSIELDELSESVFIDGGPGTTDDSTAVSDNMSKGSLGDDSASNLAVKSKSEKQADQLRKIMDSYNSMVCRPPIEENDEIGEMNQWPDSLMFAPTTEPELASTTKSGALMQSIRQRGKDNECSGGLGAALSQYSCINEKGSVLHERASTLMKRRSSGGLFLTVPNRIISFNSERKRAASPLLNIRSQYQDRPGSPKLFSTLIPAPIEPPDILRSDKSGTPVIHRPLPKKTIVGREGSSILSAKTANLSQPISSLVNRLLPYSATQFDGTRQNILPISRSPPITAGRINSNSRGSIKFYSQSPPRLSVPREMPSSPKLGISRERSVPNRAPAQSPPTQGNSNERSAPLKFLAQSPPKVGNIVRERPGSPSFRSIPKERSGSPAYGYRSRDRSGSLRPRSRDSPHGSVKTYITSRRKKAFNPFRQSDEDEVLAKRSHNRRRWSHVYPEGEVEFKRHAGPIWNSLTSPAILPLSVDHFPTPQELKDESTFQFSFYQVTLGGIENNYYEKHADLLKEMVRQRVTQDFQIVTKAAIAESEKRATESQREGRNTGKLQPRPSRRVDIFPRSAPPIKHGISGETKHYLSMGHKIQVMNYDPNSDTIEIVVYNKKSAQNDRENVHTYKFLLFSKVTQLYTTSIQTFKKYNEPYKWNRVDNLICGEEDRTMDVGMRFRRVMFGLIPEAFKNPNVEEEYVLKFQKLLLYLEKLRDKDTSDSKLNVKIIKSNMKNVKTTKDDFTKTRHDMTDTMIRFPVQLLRGKKDPFEWIEIAISSTFDTSTSYRIMFNWLVASSTKVETQLQLLQRRFTQFGLNFISFPQTTVSWDLFIHALVVPTFVTIRDKNKAEAVEDALLKLDFVYDGITITSPQFLECINNSDDYRFPHYRSGRVKAIPSPQFVHRSGALFIRKIKDRQGKVILVGIENHRHASDENMFRDISPAVMKKVFDMVESLPSKNEDLG